MKPNFPIAFLFLLVAASATAQVASHAPALVNPGQPSVSAESQASPAKPVARVNGSVLTEADLVREEYAIFPYARQHNGLPKEMAPQIRDGAMKMIVFEELVYQEAQRRRMSVPPARMAKAKVDFRKQFANPEEFSALVRSEFHGSELQLDEKIRRSLLIDALLGSEVERKSAVSAADLHAYYDNNPARFQVPESYTFQTISVLPPDHATPEQLKEGRVRADKAFTQAKATRSAVEFGLLAEKISDDDYRVMMGQHKPAPVSELAPQVLKALAAMHPGDVSDPIQIEQAWTIVKLNKHTPAGKTGFEEVKEQLARELEQTKRNQLRARLDKQLRQNAKVEEF